MGRVISKRFIQPSDLSSQVRLQAIYPAKRFVQPSEIVVMSLARGFHLGAQLQPNGFDGKRLCEAP
jgi:hypothetical protein